MYLDALHHRGLVAAVDSLCGAGCCFLVDFTNKVLSTLPDQNLQLSLSTFFCVHLAHHASHRSAPGVNRILRFSSSYCAIQISARLLRRFLIEFPKSVPRGATPRLGYPPISRPQLRRVQATGAGDRAGAPRRACRARTGAGTGGLPASQAVGCQNPFSKFPHTKSGSSRPLGAPHPGAAGPDPKTTSRVYEKGRPKGSPGERSGASQ